MGTDQSSVLEVFLFEISIGQPHGDNEEAFGNRFWISQPRGSTETAP